MTTPESRLRELVDEVLKDAGHQDDAVLRSALESVGSLASLPVPEPSGELARLLAGGGDELARRRRSGRHRPTVVGLAVLAGMGLGIGGVAATAGSAPGTSAASVQHLLGDWTPDWAITQGAAAAPTPEHRVVADPAGQAPEPDPAAGPAAGPTGPRPAKELRQPGPGVAGPAKDFKCGSPGEAKATPAGICPPAAEPSSGPGGSRNHIGGESTPDAAAPGNRVQEPVPGQGMAGRSNPGQDQTGTATSGYALQNRDSPLSGAKQAAGSGQDKSAPEKPGRASPGQGAGTGPETVPGGK
ncbi:conserved hypothetical protein [Pseudarthrobacter chlorophenolicus A6]|uniref:Uncharacterized protein n=1 Tax=Pseudarthrobacter chlorophenolicus (strain ATCC 700700 / DSM 12829 / CIP 107037 / JCM 12360 / KCTC 9906 / NCIMB 13794 / A6) TaxID=452863 RepID=B8HBV7_PSECP|nr:hypothetical protein [Pseudarthrobacter chlorophenolicus]ACL38667.1 conserved hypothetical protein [Pseudarthrobacter chlorophenolicus A6]SDQ44146.1 hypothetical protein SAMN04489738_0859 [Pseudarthrobacter chlorophenolicus]